MNLPQFLDTKFLFGLFWRAATAVFILAITRWLYHGFSIRYQVQLMKAKGAPMPAHSWLFGHLRVMTDFTKSHPSDISMYYFQRWFLDNYRTYMPNEETIPGVIYLDWWPAVSTGLILTTHPAVTSQYTQIKSLPKASVSKEFMKPLTDLRDLAMTEGDVWKSWRSRFNPVFSSKNLRAIVPALIEEVLVYVDVLESRAGGNRGWGPVFRLEDITTNLTLDVILRVIADIRLREQTRREPSSLKRAILEQTALMVELAKKARGFSQGKMPWHKVAIAKNNRLMLDFFMPFIKNNSKPLSRNTKKKTIIDSAFRDGMKNDANFTYPEMSPEFLKDLISNLKNFVFAGHDTTTTTICWIFKYLQDNPESIAKLRAEHDELFGNDQMMAANQIIQTAHKLYNLPYTLGVIKETLRLTPVAATLRDGQSGFYLSNPGDSLRYHTNGFAIWDAIPMLHRRADLWPQPDKFIPERWTVPEGDPLRPHRDAWRAFELGNRNCIGQELALIELRIVLVLVVRRFDIAEAWDEMDIEMGKKGKPDMVLGQRLYAIGSGTVHPKDGMPVHVRLRNQ